MSLHLVFSEQGLHSCLKRKHPDDIVLMLDDGVYACLKWHQARLPSDKARLLSADAKARGISDAQRGAIETVDYDGLVALTEVHSPIVSWKD
ncbi:MAG: sulfurtransferase complex subunit TusB [Proteobacteria bacterium]|nr:sulfurtransferase complex subunit TusB [Pseudomonadota bacterium]